VSERGSAFGAFLFGLGIGAALGFLFAPEAGEAARTKLSRRLRDLGERAVEKAGELAELVEGEEEEEGEREGDDDAEAAPTPRTALERRLSAAKRRRRGAVLADRAAGTEEEDEPVA
jgi:gas vesicle protein